jgi:hypothetical protein
MFKSPSRRQTSGSTPDTSAGRFALNRLRTDPLASKMRDGQIDLHDYGRRLECAIRFLNVHTKVSRKNKQKILQFLERLKAEGLSLGRQTGYA